LHDRPSTAGTAFISALAKQRWKVGSQGRSAHGTETIQQQIVEMALEHSELSPRELAVRFTDEKRYFVSEATVYRLLKAHDLALLTL